MSSDALRKQLLKGRDLTLHKAVQLCQIHESAERYSKEVSDQQEVNRPSLPQSVRKHARTVDVVMHRRRNSAQHLAKSVLRA